MEDAKDVIYLEASIQVGLWSAVPRGGTSGETGKTENRWVGKGRLRATWVGLSLDGSDMQYASTETIANKQLFRFS
jgi:hypothetical protein